MTGNGHLRGDGSLEIVIVSYRCRDLLADCLRSIAEHPYTAGPTAVTVVDNASGDGTAAAVREAFPNVRLIELAENLGFSTANNVALEQTRAERILLLNPDTEIWPGVLDEMCAFLHEHPRAGVAGCRLVQRDGSFDHAAKRSIPTVADAVRYFRRGGSGSAYLAPQVAEDESGAVDAVNGAFMLVRREAIAEAGLLDPGYWMYGEDLDWCTRIRHAGWQVLYNGRVTTLHLKGATTGSHRRPRQNIAFHRSMGRFYRRHLGGEHAALDAIVYAGIGAKLGLSVCKSVVARSRAPHTVNITYNHYSEFPGWSGAPDFLSSIIKCESCTSVLEIGSGANPTLSPAELAGRELRYTANDRSAGELEKASPAYETLLLDMTAAQPAELPHEEFDLVFSRMVNEHVADGERYYRNVFDVLRPGGVTVHCFSTLYAMPFVVNRILPERLASRLLDVVRPRDRHQHDKFPAHYSWSRGPSRRMTERLSALGYEIVEYRGYFGHPYYDHPMLTPVRALEAAKTSWLCRHPVPALTSYAVVILRKPE